MLLSFLEEETENPVGFVFALGITAVGLGIGFYWARTGLVFRTYLMSFLSWMAYLFSHYFSQGHFIDGNPEKHSYRKTLNIGLFVGGGILITGMVIGSYGLHARSLYLTIVGAVFFLSGYVKAHHSTTGELL